MSIFIRQPVTGIEMRRNLVDDPRTTAYRTSGVGAYNDRFSGEGSYTILTSSSPSARLQFNAAVVADRGFHVAGKPQGVTPSVASSVDFGADAAATEKTVYVSGRAWHGENAGLRWTARFHNGTAWVGTTVSTATNKTGSSWRTVAGTFTKPAGARYMHLMLVTTDPSSSGTAMGIQSLYVSLSPGGYFDGTTAGTGPLSYSWVGSANNSQSIETTASAADTATPVMVLGPYQAQRTPEATVHKALDASVERTVWRSAGYLRGEYVLLFSTRAEAMFAESLFAGHSGDFYWDGDGIAAMAGTFTRDMEQTMRLEMVSGLISSSPTEYMWQLTVPWKAR